jgi:hypothetical protein
VSGSEPGTRSEAPSLGALIDAELLVPVRSSSGMPAPASSVTVDELRHGTDGEGVRFVAAFTTTALLREYGPPGSDHVTMRARALFDRVAAVAERVVIDPGAPSQVEIETGVLPFLAAGIDPNRPDALRVRRPLGGLATLEKPDRVPEPFGRELAAALEELPQVERAWLLRIGAGWTVGIELAPEGTLADFDAVRNRLHAVASEHLGSRRDLAVTHLRAPALRAAYASTSGVFHERSPRRRGLLGRLRGGLG